MRFSNKTMIVTGGAGGIGLAIASRFASEGANIVLADISMDQLTKAVEELKVLFPEATNLASYALQWILSFEDISCIIPGASKESHVLSNLSVYNLPKLSPEKIEAMNKIYKEYIKPYVHQLW